MTEQRGPWDAYSYAKGRSIVLPDAHGQQRLAAQLASPGAYATMG